MKQNKKPNFICNVCKRKLYIHARTRRGKYVKRTCSPKCSKIYWRLQIKIYGRKRYYKIRDTKKFKEYQKNYYKLNKLRLKERYKTQAYRDYIKVYKQNPKYKAWLKKYSKSAKYRAMVNKRQSTPKHKAYMKTWQEKRKLLKQQLKEQNNYI